LVYESETATVSNICPYMGSFVGLIFWTYFSQNLSLLGPKIMFKSSFESEIIAKPENLDIDELLTFQIQNITSHFFLFCELDWPR
jgi:hypothetical protein